MASLPLRYPYWSADHVDSHIYIISTRAKTQIQSLSFLHFSPGHVRCPAGFVRICHPVLCGRGEPHHLAGLHQPRLSGDLRTEQRQQEAPPERQGNKNEILPLVFRFTLVNFLTWCFTERKCLQQHEFHGFKHELSI